MTTHEREKLTYQYMVALDQGDMDTVARILSRAEHDPELEQMILDMNDTLIFDDLHTTQTPKENVTMPVFTPTKRKRGANIRWTAIAAVVASILFSGFVLFFATQSPTQDYRAESIQPDATPDRVELTRTFLNAWNDNDPTLFDGLLTNDYWHSEIGTEELSVAEVIERITQLNNRFKEIHFFMSDIATNNNRIFATLTLKALHRNVAGQELNHVATGFINVAFEGNKIAQTQFTLNVDEFIQRYGQFEQDEIRQAPDFFALPPDDFDRTPQTQTIDINDKNIKGISLNIDAGHVDVRIGSLPDTVLMADISNIGAYDYNEKGTRIKLVNITNHPYYLIDESGNTPIWFFKIGEGVRTDLDVTLGNRDAMFDLQNVNLQGLTLTMGGGTTSLNLPNTGKNYHVTVKMLSSLGKLKLDYPTDVGLKIEAYDGLWQSQNYNYAESVINLQLNGSLSALDMLGE